LAWEFPLKTVRTFIAVEVPESIRKQAARLMGRLDVTSANVKWVSTEDLHLTLKFLGDVPRSEVTDLCDVVAEAVAGIKPFEAECHGGGAFPNVERPRTVFLGLGEGQDEMVALHDALEAPLAEMGFRAEHRRFRPHLTIGRVRRATSGIEDLGSLIGQHADFAAGRFTVKEVIVFSSQLRHQGPVYDVLSRAPLGTG
jgi:2'-5' RNA ligase